MSHDPFEQFALELPHFPNAACDTMHVDPETWFPETIRSIPARNALIEQAVAICKVCVHNVDCLQYALDNGINDGIWGGTLPDERYEKIFEKNLTSKRQKKLDDVRILLKRGWTLERACKDVGVSIRVYERYRYLEKAGWPY